MATVIMPFLGASAKGKNGTSPVSSIYQRTGSNCSPLEQVTTIRGYKKPKNPNTDLQQAQRGLFGGVMRAGKALKDAVKKG